MNDFSNISDELRELPIVCVQGLGFVGAAMAVAVANARDELGKPKYLVAGIDLNTPEGNRRIHALQNGNFPFPSSDHNLLSALRSASEQGNLIASSDEAFYSKASVIVVDVHLDVDFSAATPQVRWDGFRAAIKTISDRAPVGALILIETTVPPGTTEKIVLPEVEASLKARELEPGQLLIAHSYERVMPGPDYYNSIVNFWRVYSGIGADAKKKCREFLSSIVNTAEYPLTELETPTSSELSKVLENSFRAVNIAFIQEWTEFARIAGVDLFSVIDAIRMRPTHQNIRQPGFGVGGYCLTKDPAFPTASASSLFGDPNQKFPFCNMAMEVNARMPLFSLERLVDQLGGTVDGRKLLLAGVSYRSEVGDTRYSPAEIFVKEAQKLGAELTYQDPYVTYWEELNCPVQHELASPKGYDAIIFAVNHPQYREIEFSRYLGVYKPAILDANNVLSEQQRKELEALCVPLYSIGRGGKWSRGL